MNHENKKKKRTQILSAPPVKKKHPGSKIKNERTNAVRRSIASGTRPGEQICKTTAAARLQPANRNRMKTFVQTAKEQHAQTGAEIMRSLRMSDQEHNNHLFESGISFLQKVFGSENEDFRLLAYDRRFWNWYRSEWHFAQKNWLDKARTFISCPITAARELYIQHIHYKCVMSRSMYDSFDTWLKLQIETLKKETICTQTT